MAARDYYVEELAESVSQMFAAGIPDPSADEIARYHFPDKALPGEIIESVRKRLGKMRDILEEDGHSVCLLGKTYYRRFRGTPPRTVEEARRCLPLGHAMQAVGIRLQGNGEQDLIWEAMIAQNLGSGGRKFEKSLNRIVAAVIDGRIGGHDARRLLQQYRIKAEPQYQELIDSILAELPPLEAGAE